ncbi:fungal-specific transcription factor domain-containing protein [Desarmillaria tabescens]|uniref:Fungal-specific transcription factor domain-containing protein n=1 Tax=Armillaria tabescens TaxID=1929756 RepID=A0AA39K6N0_ARMTA|nr:fungal-specific transcription factor domain-containing protein [Desarmillaria tabescens]KAK0455542.1 fungal-specific transcription factor domain-containing protein [Desarmillaria tabescens]
MSSSNDEHQNEVEDASPVAKRRKMQRACDVCRRKKSEGGRMPDVKCTNCTSYSLECTYVEASKKRRHPKGYIETLENKLAKMELLLHKFMPNADIDEELTHADGAAKGSPAADASGSKRNTTQDMATFPSPSLSTIAPPRIQPSDFSEDHITDEEDIQHVALTDRLRSFDMEPSEVRFFGKSSGPALAHTAFEFRRELDEGDITNLKDQFKIMSSRRAEFWSNNIRSLNYDDIDLQPANYSFPEPDFLNYLVQLYFLNQNVFWPLLHRPTFERSLAAGLHHTDSEFGALVLLVCAVGSRYSDDPRVRADDSDTESKTRHLNGWKWFIQVHRVHMSLLRPPNLYDLQKCALSVFYVQGCAAPHTSWTLVGTGIRMAQDLGAHRRHSRPGQPRNAEEELLKRAFWVIVSLDRLISLALGRPCAIQDEDIDAEFPVDCDDEHWEHPDPEQAFVQPPDKPSLVSFFISYLALNRILALCLRTIYSLNRSKTLFVFVGKWKQDLVAELDSFLNKWVDSVPDHIRWDPHRENQIFFNQSVFLYCSYYHLQILIHRPFIPSPGKSSPLAFPSLAICTNAARSISHILDCQLRRPESPMYHCAMSIFSAAIVLLLNIWSGRRSLAGISFDEKKELSDVQKCMKTLQIFEKQLPFAGRLWDILYELASVGELPLPHQAASPSNKRERDSDSPMSVGSPPTDYSDIDAANPGIRPIISNRRVSTTYQQDFIMSPDEVYTHSSTVAQIQQYSNSVYTPFTMSEPSSSSSSLSAAAQSFSDAYWFDSNQTSNSHHQPIHGQDPSASQQMFGAYDVAPLNDGFYDQAQYHHVIHPPVDSIPDPMVMMPGGQQHVGMTDGFSQPLTDAETLAMWPTGFECVTC